MNRPVFFAVLAVALIGLAGGSDAGVIVYTTDLSGPNESPPNVSPGTGFAEVDFDNVAQTLHVHVTFSGLLGTTTASHIHAATAVPGTGKAGVATTTPNFSGFPLGVTVGTYDNTLDLTLASSYNPAYVTAHGGTPAGAESALVASLAAGTSYLNIHTTAFPGGEIRGFLEPVSTPEPATLVTIVIGALVAVPFLRKRAAQAHRLSQSA